MARERVNPNIQKKIDDKPKPKSDPNAKPVKLVPKPKPKDK